MEPQDRNPPGVLHLGIQVDVTLVAGEDFAESAHTDEGPRMVAHCLLESGAEPRRVERVGREHGVAAVALEAVAPDEPRLAVRQVSEPRNVEPSRPAVVERVRLPDQLLHEARDARSHHVLAEVVADVTARVSDARQQQEAGRFERGRSQDDHLRLGFVRLASHAVEESHPTRPAGVAVDQDLIGDGVGPYGQVARVHRGIDEPGGRIERGVDVAPARSPVAGSPAIALAPVLVVLHPVRRDAGPIGGQDSSDRREALAQLHLAPVELGGSLELAVRQVRQLLLDAGDAEVEVDFVVIGRQVGVGDGPVFTVAVVGLGLEVVVGQAEGQTAPDVGLAS